MLKIFSEECEVVIGLVDVNLIKEDKIMLKIFSEECEVVIGLVDVNFECENVFDVDCDVEVKEYVEVEGLMNKLF